MWQSPIPDYVADDRGHEGVTDDPVTAAILRVIDMHGGCLTRAHLAQGLRNLGVGTDHYSRTAALKRLEVDGIILLEAPGRDRRGFRRGTVVRVRPETGLKPLQPNSQN